MKKILQSLLILTLFISAASHAHCGSCCNSYNTCDNSCSCCDDDCCDSCIKPCEGYPFLQTRSQGQNAARNLVGWQEFVNRTDAECYYGAFSIGLEYTRTFRPWEMSKFLFGSDLGCCNSLVVQGSQVKDRNAKAWLADYFGLSPKFDTSISFCPKIQNVILDLNWFFGLDEWKKGTFLKIDVPIAWTQWELNMHETIKDDGGTTGFDDGYMSANEVNRNVLADSFLEAMSGTTTFGDMQEAIKFGRMSNCKKTKAGIADLRVAFGYNFYRDEDYHLGLFVHVAAPTGSRPNAWHLFEPIIGNGHHWELGGGITGSWIFNRDCDCEDRYCGVWLDATVSHLFKTKQCRSFDFKCKPNSRYMLLEQMGANTELLAGETFADRKLVDYQYASNLIPAINWTTFCVDVSIGVQADIAIKLGHVRGNYSFDLGYNLWARSGEKFCDNCCDDCNNCCNSCCTTYETDKTYALKGDAYVYGDNDITPVAISATQSDATIYSNLNEGSVNSCANPHIDNAQLAYIGTTTLTCGFDVNTSNPPVLVSKCMLNMCKSPSAITHKVFTNLSYAWKDNECECDGWIPFFGIGAEVEFAQGSKCCDDCNNCNCNSCCNTSCNTSCDNSCNSCCNDNCGSQKRAGISQWGLWFKGGVSFN